MTYETNRPSASSGGLLVALLLMLLLGGIGVVGLGSWYWLRAESTARQEAAMELRASAVAQMEAATREARAQQALQPSEDGRLDLPSADVVDVLPAALPKAEATVAVDKDGNITVHGHPVTRDELPTTLQSLIGENGSNLSIRVWADEDCAFRDVAEVVRICRASGASAIRLAIPENEVGAAPAEPN